MSITLLHLVGGLLLVVGTILQPTVLFYKIGLNGTEFGISYIFFAAFFLVSIFFLLKNCAWVLKTKPVSILILLLLYATFLSSRVGGGAIIGLSFVLLSVFYATSLNYRGQTIFEKLIFLLGVIVCVIGWWLYKNNVPLFDPLATGSDLYFMTEDDIYRAMSVFMNPNSFGYFLVFLFCIALTIERPNIFFFLLGLIIFGYMLIATGSRSSQAAVVLACLMRAMFLLKPRLRNISVRFLLGIVVVGLFAILISLSALSEIDVRAERWISGWEVYRRNIEWIVFGVPNEIDLGYRDITFSDNFFLLLLYRAGIFGFFLFLVFYFTVIRMALRVVCGNVSPLERGSALFLLASLIPMFFSNFLLFVPINAFWGIALGLTIRGYRRLSKVRATNYTTLARV